jgi:hypothetical protein
MAVLLKGKVLCHFVPWRLMNIHRRFRSIAAPTKVSNDLPIDTA